MTDIAITACYAKKDDAILMAKKLRIDFVEDKLPSEISDYLALLILDFEKLSLQQCGKNAAGAIYVDFVSGVANHRRKFGGGKSQMLAKAIGLNKFKAPHVLDATAGLGRDSFVLACLGCTVDMVERSPIIHELLKDGLKRASNDEDIANIIANMSLFQGDSYEYISNLTQKPDVIYLDPMFPSRDKSALVKKEMRIFKEILGTDEDSDKLLDISLEKAKRRVVVKRPKNAPPLNKKKPTFVMEGKVNRFDIYVVATLS